MMTLEEIKKENAKPWMLSKTLIQKGIPAEFECDLITIEFENPPVVKVSYDAHSECEDTVDIEYHPDPDEEYWTEEKQREFEDVPYEQVTFRGVNSVRELTGVYFVFFEDGDRMRVWKERVKAVFIQKRKEEYDCNCEVSK